MAKDPYLWIPGEPPPLREIHSRAKHEVLSSYLERYVEVLTGRIHRDSLRLTLVDGFSGGGLFLDKVTGKECFGSPLLMLDAMQKAAVKAQALRKKSFSLDCRFVFLDQDPNALAFLRGAIDGHNLGASRDRLDIVQGTFEQRLPELLKDIEQRGKRHRTIFVLDQYGYSDVPMNLLREIFSRLSNAEVILTFMADWLIDYLSDSDISRTLLDKVGVGFPATSVKDLKQQSPDDWRRTIQFGLHQDIHQKSGAKYYTPFFIRSEEAHRDYWLLHFSNHPKARDVMMELHWQLHNHFVHYGRAGLNMLGYSPSHDLEAQGYSKGLFEFNEHARHATDLALQDDIPRRIIVHKSGITFEKFFADVTNETPATRQILADAVQELSQNRELEIRDPDGKKRERGVKPRNEDIILVPKHRLLIR